jgi:hypothetical protein
MIEVLEQQSTVEPLDTPTTVDLGAATNVDVITVPVTALQAIETLAPIDVIAAQSVIDLTVAEAAVIEVISPGPQGIKGDTGAPGTGAAIFNETPAGLVNGLNLTFLAASNFRSETLVVYLNGLRQAPTDDFIVVGPNAFQMTAAPLSNDKLKIDYFLL